jgi:hypothetical protein
MCLGNLIYVLTLFSQIVAYFTFMVKFPVHVKQQFLQLRIVQQLSNHLICSKPLCLAALPICSYHNYVRYIYCSSLSRFTEEPALT